MQSMADADPFGKHPSDRVTTFDFANALLIQGQYPSKNVGAPDAISSGFRIAACEASDAR